jgi:hypothetical protein
LGSEAELRARLLTLPALALRRLAERPRLRERRDELLFFKVLPLEGRAICCWSSPGLKLRTEAERCILPWWPSIIELPR